METYLIAEMAGCHDMIFSSAKKLIDISFESDCSAVKTQWCSDIKKMALRRKIKNYRSYKLLDFPVEWHEKLAKECHERRMDYICSVFLKQDVNLIARYADKLKIASLEAMDSELIEACLNTGMPIIISTGCMNKKEIETLYNKYSSFKKISLLHAVSSYPVPIGCSDLSLLSHPKILLDGYSDQTGRVITGALAAMYYPKIIEVHIRLNITSQSNPDYNHSLSPLDLKKYSEYLKIAEKERGTGSKKIQESEIPLRRHRVIR